MEKTTMRKILLFVTLLFSLPIAAQEAQRPVIVDASIQSLDLNPGLWFFEDSDQAFEQSDLLTPKFNALFRPTEKKTPNFGFSNSAWWARIPLHNRGNQPVSFLISESYALVDRIEYWLVDPAQGIISQGLDGDKVKSGGRDVRYRVPAFRVQLPEGESYLYFRIKTQGSVVFDIDLRSEADFAENKLVEYSFLYSMFSILTVMALYNFLIWIQLRRVTYLIYVAVIASVLGQFVIVSGLISEYIAESRWLMNEGYLLIAHISMFVSCLFPIAFLSLSKRHPWLMRFSVVELAMVCVSYAVSLISYNLGGQLLVSIGVVASFFTLGVGIICSLKRFRPAYFFTLAWSFILVANFLRMAMLTGNAPAIFIIEWGVLIGSVADVVLLSLGMADKIRVAERLAFERIESLNADLQAEHAQVVNLNNNLEQLVEEQTREIKSILNHIQIGIMVVRKPGLQITDTHSASVKTLFEKDHISARPIMEILFERALISQEVKSQVQSALESCLEEESIAFEMNNHLLPHEIAYISGEDQRSFQVDWNPVIDAAGRIEKMLVTVKDVTALKKLEIDAAEKTKELALIGEILDVPPRQFGIFISTSHAMLADSMRLLKTNANARRDVLKMLFINMHTIKGAARSLGLKLLTPVIHDVEQNLSAVLQNEKPWNHDELLRETERVQGLINHYLELNQTRLGRTSAHTATLSLDFISRLHQTLSQIEQDASGSLKIKVKPLRETLEDLAFIRAEQVFREVLANAEMLARDLSKEVPDIAIRDNGIQLSTEGQDFVRKVFLHIIRNSMDHGIETARERVQAGKKPQGLIEVQLEKVGGLIQIRYRDDGRGLNLRSIRNLAQQRGLLSPEVRLGLEDVAYLIFEPGFSTSSEVSEISGRGVGMSAVREYVEKCRGQLVLRLLHNVQAVDPDYVPFEIVFMIDGGLSVAKAA
jgi:hypothetical protein